MTARRASTCIKSRCCVKMPSLLLCAFVATSALCAGGCSSSSNDDTACPYLGSAGGTLVDDLEDGNGLITLPRTGYWVLKGPAPSVVAPPDGTAGADYHASDDGTGNLAIHAAGKGFTEHSALLQVTLRSKPRQDTATGCIGFDASTFTGIKFRMKGSTSSGYVRLNIAELQTVWGVLGGTCNDGCNDHFGVRIPVNPKWTDVSVHWNDLAQVGWGAQTGFDPATITLVEWLITPTYDDGPDFDIWVDDLAFQTD